MGPASIPKNEGRPPRIAVVDDDPHIRSALTSLLRAAGFAPCVFASAASLLADAGSAFSCVVSDLQMPGMSGLDLARLLKAQAPQVPVILMTAFADEDARRDAEALGVSSFVEKPFDPAGLLDRIATLVEPAARS